MDTSRYVYNKCVNELKEHGNDSLNFQTLRNKLVTSKGNNLPDWEIKVPKDIRAESVRDLVKAYDTAFSNLQNGNISHFNVGYRLKKNGYQSIVIPKTAIKILEGNEFQIYPRITKSTFKKCKRDNFPEIKHDCRLKVDNCGHWYLIIPYSVEISNKKRHKNKCSLDPGIRKFQTLYSDTEAIKFKTNYELLKKLKDNLSFLQKQRACKKMSEKTYNKKYFKSWNRHKNLIDDFQFKLCNFITQKYSQVYLPKFESQKLTKNLAKTSNFNLLNLQHYKFKERLKFKCSKNNCKLTIVTEEYTSKTCTKCGTLNDVGSSEIFKCNKCQLIIDRDYNGARNIYLKSETKN